jgi:hypothetical protein
MHPLVLKRMALHKNKSHVVPLLAACSDFPRCKFSKPSQNPTPTPPICTLTKTLLFPNLSGCCRSACIVVGAAKQNMDLLPRRR